MNEALFLLVNVVIVAVATGVPVANERNEGPAAVQAINAEDMIMVGKRAKEMVYFGNQQNEPRVPMKKSLQDPIVLPQVAAPLGEEDQGGQMVAHQEIPVEEDLNGRAEAVKGETDLDRLAEGMKVAEEQVDEAAEDKQEEMDEKDVEETVNNDDDEDNAGNDDAMMTVDLPESGENNEEAFLHEGIPVTDMVQDDEDDADDDDDDDNADEELASLSNEAGESTEEGDEDSSDDEAASIDDSNSNSNDDDVEDFLDELRKESDDVDDQVDDNSDNEDDDDGREMNAMAGENTNSGPLKDFKVEPENSGVVDPNYYQTLYHILTNSYRGADDYYNNYNMMVPADYYLNRRRRSSMRRRDLASIRSRRNGHIRRIKRDLPSDWLAAYRGLDLPYSDEAVDDSLLSEPEETYEDEEPINEELSRYIYANLLNKIYGDGLKADVEEEIPYEEILPYELSPEIPDALLEQEEQEKYDPEEILYEPEVENIYRESPYEDYAPSYGEYRKRSGGSGYYGDSMRKRYFFPVYEEPETHWGGFVPEKRSGSSSSSSYDDALQRLQRLAFALSDNPRPYYETLLREYEKKK